MTSWKYTPELDISFQHCERPAHWQGEEVVCSKCQQVMPESVFTCEHCGDGLATETLETTGEKVCPDCVEFLDPERWRSWGEMADLTHVSQVRIFGWCACEDSSAPYDDCPKTESEEK
jgi:hypothetical protein